MATIDALDFNFRKQVKGGCKKCSILCGSQKYVNYVQRDPGLFDFVVKIRRALRKKPPTADDMSDDDSLQEHKKNQFQFLSKKISELSSEDIAVMGLSKEEKFQRWRAKMLEQMKINMKKREIESRPNYHEFIDQSVLDHLNKYFKEFDSRTFSEQ